MYELIARIHRILNEAPAEDYVAAEAVLEQQHIEIKTYLAGIDMMQTAEQHVNNILQETAAGKPKKYAIIKAHFNLDEPCENTPDLYFAAGQTVLTHAAKKGRANVINAIRYTIANLNSTNTAGETALGIAVAQGDRASVEALLSLATHNTNGQNRELPLADVNALTRHGEFLTKDEPKVHPLFIAAKFHPELIPALITTYGANVNVTHDDVSLIHYLLSQLNEENQSNYLPAIHAALDAFAINLNVTDKDKKTVLMAAAQALDNVKLLTKIFEKGDAQNLNQIFVDKVDATFYAASNGNHQNLNYLLQQNLDPWLTNSHSENALHHAAASGSVDCLNLLLTHPERRDHLEDRDSSAFTALHLAAKNKHAGCVLRLLEESASPNNEITARIGKKEETQTPLSLALDAEDLRTVLYLLLFDAEATDEQMKKLQGNIAGGFGHTVFRKETLRNRLATELNTYLDGLSSVAIIATLDKITANDAPGEHEPNQKPTHEYYHNQLGRILACHENVTKRKIKNKKKTGTISALEKRLEALRTERFDEVGHGNRPRPESIAPDSPFRPSGRPASGAQSAPAPQGKRQSRLSLHNKNYPHP